MASRNRAPVVRLAADHTYWLGRERILGCTELLKTLGFIDDTWYDDRSTERGSAVHEHAAAIDRKTPKRLRPALREDWSGYHRSWEAWKTVWRPTWFTVEGPLVDTHLRIAGRPDRVALIQHPALRPHIGIPDLKTGHPEPWHLYQASIYILLVRRWLEQERTTLAKRYPTADLADVTSYGVYLRENGMPPRVRNFPFQPETYALITTAQLKRSLFRYRG